MLPSFYALVLQEYLSFTLYSHTRATFPVYLTFLDLITLIIW